MKLFGPRNHRPGHVYFVWAPEVRRTKIGWSEWGPRGRVDQMQVGSPTPLRLLGWTAGTMQLERIFHSRFESRRSHGEWFDITPEDVLHLLEVRMA